MFSFVNLVFHAETSQYYFDFFYQYSIVFIHPLAKFIKSSIIHTNTDMCISIEFMHNVFAFSINVLTFYSMHSVFRQFSRLTRSLFSMIPSYFKIEISVHDPGLRNAAIGLCDLHEAY